MQKIGGQNGNYFYSFAFGFGRFYSYKFVKILINPFSIYANLFGKFERKS